MPTYLPDELPIWIKSQLLLGVLRPVAQLFFCWASKTIDTTRHSFNIVTYSPPPPFHSIPLGHTESYYIFIDGNFVVINLCVSGSPAWLIVLARIFFLFRWCLQFVVRPFSFDFWIAPPGSRSFFFRFIDNLNRVGHGGRKECQITNWWKCYRVSFLNITVGFPYIERLRAYYTTRWTHNDWINVKRSINETTFFL